jgi:hypothetical protein
MLLQPSTVALHGAKHGEIITVEARQHGGGRQGIRSMKAARMDARATPTDRATLREFS